MQFSGPFRRRHKAGSYPQLTVGFSVTLALFVIGLCGLLLLHARRLSVLLRENIEVQVYLEKNVTASQRQQLSETLATRPYALPTTDSGAVRFISREEAASAFVREMGEDPVALLGENPLRDAFVLRIREEFQSEAAMQGIAAELDGLDGVHEAVYQANQVRDTNRNLGRLAAGLLLFGGVLLATAVLLIGSSIRLALFSQRFLIRSMQLVGATAGFIRRPFLVRAGLQGLISALAASGGLLLLLRYANNQVEELSQLQKPLEIAFLLLFLCGLGVFVTVASTFNAMRRYLRMSLDELY